MSRCEQCEYQWPDVDEESNLIRAPYCHYEGPDAWAPCNQDDYVEEDDPAEEWAEEQHYEEWLDYLQSMEEESAFEEYGAPYDYKEF